MSVVESENPIHAATTSFEVGDGSRTTIDVERDSVFEKPKGQVARQPSIAYLESLKKKKEATSQSRRGSNDHFSLKKRLEALEINGKFKKRYLCAAVFAFCVAGFLFTIAGIIAHTEQQAQANILFILGSIMVIICGYYMYQFLGRLYLW